MRKLLKFIFLFGFIFLFFPHKSLADSNFSTSYNVTYNVQSNADTLVNINATLTNLTDKYYASSYRIDIGFNDIKNIRAFDSNGTILPKVISTSKGSEITLNFNSPVAGLGRKLNFTLSFDTSEVAQNFKNTWDINIPGIANQNDFNFFNVSVTYPGFLGSPTYIKPEITSHPISSSANSLYFTKEDLGGSGISIAFGNFQIYDFNLVYHLQNTNLFPISTEIALPPSTNYQDAMIDSINPKPLNVTMDKDGNWLAKYYIASSKSVIVDVKEKVKVYLNPRAEGLNKNVLADYLKPQPYWQSDNPEIVSLARQLKTPYAIYQYVVKTLHYDFSRVQTQSPRLGAVKALNEPNSAVCLEFTDLFIALSRAAGIPAREIDGYGYTTNTSERPLSLVEDILHAWPEYYDFDRKTWVMVDPTWGNTTGGIDYFNTLDFDHIAFVIKGENNSYPVPAGGYKLVNSKPTKDISVSIGTNFSSNAVSSTTSLQMPNTIIAGTPFQAYLTVYNTGNILLGKQQIDISDNILLPKDQTLTELQIPPYGHTTIPVYFNPTPFLTNARDTIKITVGKSTYYKKVRIVPFFVSRVFLTGGLILIAIFVDISLIAYLYRRISLFRQRE